VPFFNPIETTKEVIGRDSLVEVVTTPNGIREQSKIDGKTEIVGG